MIASRKVRHERLSSTGTACTAARLARDGFHVFPCKPRSKAPATPHGFRDATSDPDRVARWWATDAAYNPAIWPGPSGVLVLDIDPRKGGEASVEKIEAEHGKLPETLTVYTGRGDGGRHLYLQHPGGEIGNAEIAGELDVRADRGYVLVPPAIHPDTGAAYYVDDPDGDGETIDRAKIAPCPDWLAELARVGVTERDREDRGNLSILSAYSVLSVTDPSDPDALDNVLASTLPEREGERNRRLFDLARTLKAIPSLTDASAKDVMRYVRRWHKAALPAIGTKPFEDTQTDFEYAWKNVRYPKGTGPMADMLSRADAADCPPCARHYESADTVRLVKLCRELQRPAGDGPFFLSCRTASELLKINRMTAWRRLKRLMTDEVLAVVEVGTKTRATRYRYTGD